MKNLHKIKFFNITTQDILIQLWYITTYLGKAKIKDGQVYYYSSYYKKWFLWISSYSLNTATSMWFSVGKPQPDYSKVVK